MLLAQIGGKGGADVARLADPPAGAYYLLENPWPVAIALVVAAAIGAMLFRQRGGTGRGVRLVVAGIAGAAVVLILGYAVTTERETLRDRTRRLVDAAARGSSAELGPMLMERTRVGAFAPVFGGVRGREEVVAAVRAYIEQFGPLESWEKGFVQAVVDGPNIARTQVRVWAKPRKDAQIYGAATGMWFRVEWRRVGDGPWRASTIDVMQIDGVGVNGEIGGE